jgi:hypothetical protein
MANATDITINLLHYNDWYTLRKKDAGKHHWFSFPNDLLIHPDFFGVTGDEFKAFVWCVSICSKIRNSELRLNVPHACSLLSIQPENFFSMFNKLKGKQIDIVGDHGATIESRSKATTEEKKREENIREEESTGEVDEVSLIVDFWNSHESLPQVQKLTSARRVKIKLRLKESGLEGFKSAIVTITQTPFLLGQNDRQWKADLDWLIANETNLVKVTEGKYSKQNAKAKQSQGQNAFDVAKAQIDAINRGEL